MIPDYQTLMLPVLEVCSQGTVSIKEAISILARQFDLSEEDRAQLIARGTRTVFYDRITWAKTYLKQAGLVQYPARGKFAITEAGRKVLQSNPERIDNKFLDQFEPFREFLAREGTRSRRNDPALTSGPEPESHERNPGESLRLAYETIRDVLAADLLDRVRNAPPEFFEILIVRLLIAMGYGGTAPDAGRVLGRSGDGGVDGVIDQDALGMDQIYVQAKRYQEENNIGAGAIREFFGALSLKKAQKGIFFTSSGFSPSARKTAEDLERRIVLIDGERLANLMIDYNIGCREEETIQLKKVDEDFFEQEE